MKVLLVSSFVPTEHNFKGPSALPYYLSKGRPADVQLDLVQFSSKKNEDAAELRKVFNKIFFCRETPPYLYYPLRFLQKAGIFKCLHGISLRHLPNLTFLRRVKKEQYDCIWVYPHTMYPWYAFLSKFKFVLTGPDCSHLHQVLVSQIFKDARPPMNDNYQVKNNDKLLRWSETIERKWSRSKALLHVVGNEDRKMYEALGAKGHCFFSLHPYSSYIPVQRTIEQTNGKLRVLISGVNHSIYIGHFWQRISELLIRQADYFLTSQYSFFFLGKNFDKSYLEFKAAGYEATLLDWVDSYEELVAQSNIQIFPIILGTGTKGKVLSALAAGVFCIGTRHAFENILIDETDAAIVESEQEVISILIEIVKERHSFSEKAARAAEKVRHSHSPAVTASTFWNVVTKFVREENHSK